MFVNNKLAKGKFTVTNTEARGFNNAFLSFYYISKVMAVCG